MRQLRSGSFDQITPNVSKRHGLYLHPIKRYYFIYRSRRLVDNNCLSTLLSKLNPKRVTGTPFRQFTEKDSLVSTGTFHEKSSLGITILASLLLRKVSPI